MRDCHSIRTRSSQRTTIIWLNTMVKEMIEFHFLIGPRFMLMSLENFKRLFVRMIYTWVNATFGFSFIAE